MSRQEGEEVLPFQMFQPTLVHVENGWDGHRVWGGHRGCGVDTEDVGWTQRVWMDTEGVGWTQRVWGGHRGCGVDTEGVGVDTEGVDGQRKRE